MAETDLSEPTTIDRDTMLVGLTAIGVRLYADSGEALNGDGAFGRMVADYDSRSRASVAGEPVMNLERDSIDS
jgi:hypothetical protein